MQIKSRKGQTMIEYILIVTLIAVALIGVVTWFRTGLANKFADATEAVDAEAGAEARAEADELADQSGGFKKL